MVAPIPFVLSRNRPWPTLTGPVPGNSLSRVYQWRLLPTPPEDHHLSGPVGAWNGEKLLVIGVARTQPANEMPHLAGSAYNQETDSWRTLAPLPLSVPDDEGLAGSLLSVRTGSEMAVWLPAPYFGETPQLGLYDPSTDQWRLSPHLPLSADAWDMTFTDTHVAILTDTGLLLYDAA